MALPLSDALRLRLLFDYPPPGTPHSAQCWLLLERGACRLVTDLSCLIRRRFGFSGRARLSLYLQESLLPPCEPIGLVRDNDTLRVKLEAVQPEGDVFEVGNDIRSPRNFRKRPMQESEEELEKEEDCHRKKKKKKKKKKKAKFEVPPSLDLNFEKSDLENKAKKMKTKPERTRESSPVVKENGVGELMKEKKKKKQKEGSREIGSENNKKKVKHVDVAEGKKALDVSVSADKERASRKVQVDTRKKVKRASSGDSSSASSVDDKAKQPPKKSQTPIEKKDSSQPVTGAPTADTAANHLAAPTVGLGIKPAIRKAKAPSSSSSVSDSSDEGGSKLGKNRTETSDHFALNNAPSQPPEKKPPPSSESSDSDSFVIRKPTPGPLRGIGNASAPLPALYGPVPNPGGAGRGLGRGFGRGEDTWRGPRGRGLRGRVRGRGRGDANNIPFDYNSDCLKQQHLNEHVTNGSIIIQNPPTFPYQKMIPTRREVPKLDYSAMPLLAAAPQVGQKIAFKLLELTENYTPQVSDYKEGRIVNFNQVTQQLELDLLSASEVVKEPGKFDLVYESASGRRTIEYAVSQDSKITEKWTSLIEPRLIVETLSVPAVSTNQEDSGNVAPPQ